MKRRTILQIAQCIVIILLLVSWSYFLWSQDYKVSNAFALIPIVAVLAFLGIYDHLRKSRPDFNVTLWAVVLFFSVSWLSSDLFRLFTS